MWLINTDLDTTKRYRPKMGSLNHNVLLPESQKHVINPTNPRGALDDCVKHRLHVGRGSTDDAEHFRSSGLMLQGLTQFRVALLDLLEQSHVLDGDDGLVGKGFEKGDLLISERTDLRADNTNNPQRNTLSKQGRGDYCPMAEPTLTLLGVGKLGFALRFHVMDMKGLAVKYRSSD